MSDLKRWAKMNLHIQAVLALMITAVSGYTASVVAAAYSSIYRGQPLPRLTEFTLKNGKEIYWIAIPIIIFALWGMGMAVANKSQQKKSMIMISISIFSAISVIVLLVAWSRPLVRTTFGLS